MVSFDTNYAQNSNLLFLEHLRGILTEEHEQAIVGTVQQQQQQQSQEPDEDDCDQKVLISSSSPTGNDINNNGNNNPQQQQQQQAGAGNDARVVGEQTFLAPDSLARTRQLLFNSTNNPNYVDAFFPCGVFTSEELFRLSRGKFAKQFIVVIFILTNYNFLLFLS